MLKMPPALDPIMLGNVKYPRPGELRRVLGVPSASKDRSFVVSHPKPRAVVGNELEHMKETVDDVSNQTRLDKYRETLNPKNPQQSGVLPGVQILKAGIRIQGISNDAAPLRLENHAKNLPLNKHVCTSVADLLTAVRQQVFPDQDGNIIPAIGCISRSVEENTRRLFSGGEGSIQKIRKKRSVGAVGNSALNADRDVKRPAPPKLAVDSKLRSCDSNILRLKSAAGVSGINKSDGSFEPSISDSSPIPKAERIGKRGNLSRNRVFVLDQSILVNESDKPNIKQNNSLGSLQTIVKGKISKTQRTGSAMTLGSTTVVHPPSGAFQVNEQASVKVEGINQKSQTSNVPVIHPMTQWGGQKPHKNSRIRRKNLVFPFSNNSQTQVSSQAFEASKFGVRTSTIGTAGVTLSTNMDSDSTRIIRETDNVSSLFGLSESDDSRAGEKEAVMTTPQNARAFVLPVKINNKLSSNESGDGLKRRGRGRGSLVPPGVPPIKDKSKKVLASDSRQDVTAISDKNKRIGKMGHPPSKKWKDRKGLPRLQPTLSNGSSEFTGESDYDHEELYLAAKSVRNASNLGCSNVFWEKMECNFANVRSEDAMYLNQQLRRTEELCDSLSQMFGNEIQMQGLDEGFSGSGKRQGTQSGKLGGQKFEKVIPLYQRVLSALIDEDESEEFNYHSEVKKTSLQSFSHDSHCGSSSQFDTEPKDTDRTENEVESNLGFQINRNCLVDSTSCDGNGGTNTFRSPIVSTSLHTNERCKGYNEFLHADSHNACEITSSHVGQLQARESDFPESPLSDCQYHEMSIDDEVLLELQRIGLFPEPQPDLAEVGDTISGNIIELKEELYKQVSSKKHHLGKIDKDIQKVRDSERRNIEQIAMDKLVEVTYRSRKSCRGGNASKSVVRKVSDQASMAFVNRTLARCQQFEKTGKSSFINPKLQELLFSEPQSQNGLKPVDIVGSGTATKTCNEAFYQADISDNQGSPALTRGKKREAPIDGSMSSRVNSGLDNRLVSLTDRKTKPKLKQKISDQSASGNNKPCKFSLPKEAATDLDKNLPLNELDSLEDMGGNQDLSSWLNFEEDDLLDHDLNGLEIPTDDLSDLNMLI